MRFPIRARRLALLFAAVALGTSGCGEEKGERIVSVTGTVTRKGKPVAGLLVTFVPQTGKNSYPSYGITNENGEYYLTNRSTGERGATVGTQKVWVSIPPVPPDDDDKKKAARAKTSGDLAEILKKYGKLESTTLTFEIKGDQVIDLPLD